MLESGTLQAFMIVDSAIADELHLGYMQDRLEGLDGELTLQPSQSYYCHSHMTCMSGQMPTDTGRDDRKNG